jgi:hypothetical protein
VEMGIQSEQLTLHWASCGPDLSAFERVNMLETARLLRQFGEIRVRYAAHLTKNALNRRDPDPALWLRVTVSACDKGWHTAYAQKRISEIIRHNYVGLHKRRELPIPWLKLYMPGLTKDQREYVQCASVHRGTRELENFQMFNERIDSTFRELTESVLLQTPDLRMENVLPWLCFIEEGHKDPQLLDAHREFQPFQSLKEHARYCEAWASLTRF